MRREGQKAGRDRRDSDNTRRMTGDKQRSAFWHGLWSAFDLGAPFVYRSPRIMGAQERVAKAWSLAGRHIFQAMQSYADRNDEWARDQEAAGAARR